MAIRHRLNQSPLESLKSGPLRVSIIGSGAWASAVAILIGPTVKSAFFFKDEFFMWVYSHPSDTVNRAEIINKKRRNSVYMPNFELPPNLVATSSLEEAVRDADLLIINMPHQFVYSVIRQMKPYVKKDSAKAISLVKGMHLQTLSNGIKKPMLFSELITQELGIPCDCLSGANVAVDIAAGQFCETTIGYSEQDTGTLWQILFDAPNCRVDLIPDVKGVQACGAVKNLIAVAAGFCDGMGLGSNTKAAIIRIGVIEMRSFAATFWDDVLNDTFFESCGIADVITTCIGGRNVRCAKEFILRGGWEGKTTWDAVEADLLEGQKMQGHLTCQDVYQVLSSNEMENAFPLFVVTYKIAFEGVEPAEMLRVFRSKHPRLMRTKEECTTVVLSRSLSKSRSAS